MRPRLPDRLLQDTRSMTAVTQALYFAGGLCWFTQFQFLIRFACGYPGLSNPAYALTFYEDLPGHPFNLPQFIMGLSIVAAGLAIFGVWFTSRGTRGKWRQRILVAFFGAVCCWFASLFISQESLFLDHAKSELEWRKENPLRTYPPDTPPEILSREWIHLEVAIKKAEQRRKE
jgi:hypothetical protein